MKKTIIFFLMMGMASICFGQMKLGLKVSPNLIFNRLDTDADTVSFERDGIHLRPAVTITADYMFAQNYQFSTGLGYISKKMRFDVNKPSGNLKGNYIAQYVQLPVTLKLNTNEVDLDKRLYFQIGGIFDIKIYDENKGDDDVIDKIRPLDVGLIFGAGGEMYLGTSTLLSVGLTYQRGLVNVIKRSDLDTEFSLKNDMFGIDVGIKF